MYSKMELKSQKQRAVKSPYLSVYSAETTSMSSIIGRITFVITLLLLWLVITVSELTGLYCDLYDLEFLFDNPKLEMAIIYSFFFVLALGVLSVSITLCSGDREYFTADEFFGKTVGIAINILLLNISILCICLCYLLSSV